MRTGARKTWRNLAAAFAAASAIAVATAGCIGMPSGLGKRYVDCDGARRVYWMHVPERLSAERPAPLVVVLHRFTETAPIIARQTGFNALADAQGFLVAYPQGQWRRFRFEGAGAAEEIVFIRAVVGDVARSFPVDPKRVYAVGASCGGFMAYRLAAEASDVFAAAAPVMATMPRSVSDGPPRSDPLSMVIIHGTEDPIVPYGKANVFAGPRKPLRLMPIPETVAYWARVEGCAPEPERESIKEDGASVVCECYVGGRAGAEVRLYAVQGGGHTWPGGWEFFPSFMVGRKTPGFDATRAIWEFFERHAKP